MKKVAVVIAATLVLAIVSPAFSQPFADVPTDHWAFDAIAELAAKGLIEGYPDGTFKGDRAMTRYEIAMVVARLLARIEAIKIPAPPPAAKIDVSRADITTLQRLINEFRAELAALGVRVTAVEEELAALRGRLDNTRVTGTAFIRGNWNVAGGSGSSLSQYLVTFTGRVAPTASATFRLVTGQDGGVFLLGNPVAAPYGVVNFDRAYIDLSFLGFNWRAGRQTYDLGPVGLLFAEGSTNFDAMGVDGVSVSGAFGPVGIEAAAFKHSGAIDLLMARAGIGLIPGWTIGVNLYQERHNFTSPTPNTQATGWSVDVDTTILPGVSLTAEYASFTPVGGTAQTAYWVTANVNLGQLTGMTSFSPSLAVWYKNWTTWSPLFSGASDVFGINYTGAGGAGLQGFGATLTLTVSPMFRPYITYESGTANVGAVSYNETELGFRSTVAQNTTARVRYQRRTESGTLLTHRYRLELTYTW